jgi:PAS domain S-box-containing protein
MVGASVAWREPKNEMTANGTYPTNACTPTGEPLSPPPVLGGRFQIQRLLKQGNGVETLLGIDLLDGAAVVIKTAVVDSLSLGAQMRLEHEASVLQHIRGAGVAPLVHVGRDGGLFYLVMPLVPGITLQDRLRRGPLSVRDTLTLGCCLFSGLQTVHDHGVLHRDLKPANLIVDEETPLQQATIIDFGLARSARLDWALRDQPVGTARYMSPELAGLLDHDKDERSDLYSAGIVLFECLAGHAPFEGDNVGEVLRQHLTAQPPELRTLGLAVPRALDEVIQRLLRKDPRERYQRAAAVVADLSAIATALDRGIVEPALVVGLHDQRRSLTEPAFVGRTVELAALDLQLARLRQGEGGIVLLAAESGGGKTRLLAEMAQRSARQGHRVLRGQGEELTGQRPFQVLVGVIADLIACARQDPSLGSLLRQRLGDHHAAACAALPELAEILGQQPAEALGPETFGQVRTQQALAALLDALGCPERPTLVLLDDCQWADELTLSLLAYWQRRQGAEKDFGRHVLLVVGFRLEEVAAAHPLRALRPSLQLELLPFTARDVQRLTESMAGPLPAEAVEVVERLAQGSPFMARAVLQGLVESGALLAGPSGWTIQALALADVQSSRHAAAFLVRRVELLPAEVITLLSAAAVLGKEFDLAIAATLAGQSPSEAVTALDEARRRHIVWAGAQDVRCSFIHDKLRQTLLERLGGGPRQELHRKAAQYLERKDPKRIFELAYHFDAAGDSQHALPYALAAAEQARAQHSLEVAEQQYRIARRGMRDQDEAVRYRIAEGIGDVLMLRGRYEQAAPEFQLALTLAGSDVARAQVEGKLGELAFKRGDVKTAGQRIERALRLLGRRIPKRSATFLVLVVWEVLVQALHSLAPSFFLGRRALAGADKELIALRLYSRLAHLYWFHRGTFAALWAHLRELNLAECYPPTLELAQAYSEHAPAMSLIPWFRRGIAFVEKSLVIRQSLGDLWGQGQSLHFHGIILYASSRFQECIEKCREAIRLLERTGDQWEVNIARYQIAASLYRLGDLQGAVAEARRMHQSGVELGDAQASGISLDIWARASLGRVPEEVLQAELLRPREDAQRTAQVLAAEGARLVYAGRPREAAALLLQGQQTVVQAGVRNAWVSPLLPWLATAYREAAQAEQSVSPGPRRLLLRQAARAARRGLRLARHFQNELPHALRECALLAAAGGRHRRARKWFDESLAVAERQGAMFEHALTLEARGRVGSECGWRGAEADADQAREALRALTAAVQAQDQGTASAAAKPVTMSLVDRFDTVLDTGRRIAAALSREATFTAVREAALRLLRGDRCVVLKLEAGPDGGDSTTASGELDGSYSRAMARQAVEAGRAVAFLEGAPDNPSESVILSGVRSALCAPIAVRGRPVACLYVTHRQIAGLFGEDEKRLADFIATLAGAALENAEGFDELKRLNAALELRVLQYEGAKRKIEEQAALLDKSRDAILVQDLEDTILFWNRSAERLYGWAAAEALGQEAGKLLLKGPSRALKEATQVSLERGEWVGELQQVTHAGKEIVVESRWTLVRDDAGKPKCRLIVNTDITEKKKLEARFLRAQRLESLGTLAGGVAHDINNVLTPIMMSVELLKMDLPPDQRLALLGELEASAQRGADMVKQILSFARGVEGKRVQLQLRHLIREIDKMLLRTLPKTIELDTAIDRNLWTVNGDPTQLYQLLMNLCVNARDAMPAGGRIVVRAENTELAAADCAALPDVKPGPYVRLTVSDTGTGIPAEIQDKIFDPFFTTKEYGKGTGLGLSTVLGIVKGHGGTITLSSTEGDGTEFQVLLPAAEVAAPAQQEQPSRPAAGSGELILIVDDEAAVRTLLQRNLEANGYQVLTARDGSEGVALYAQHREEIHLVLTDMMMPRIDGLGLARAVHAINPLARIIAGSGLAASAETAEKAGTSFQAFLLKPYSAEKLLKTVSDVLHEA